MSKNETEASRLKRVFQLKRPVSNVYVQSQPENARGKPSLKSLVSEKVSSKNNYFRHSRSFSQTLAIPRVPRVDPMLSRLAK